MVRSFHRPPRPLLPAPTPGAPGPFALSDEAAPRGLAEAAGLTPVEVTDVACPFVYSDLPTALQGLSASGLAVRHEERRASGSW